MEVSAIGEDDEIFREARARVCMCVCVGGGDVHAHSCCMRVWVWVRCGCVGVCWGGGGGGRRRGQAPDTGGSGAGGTSGEEDLAAALVQFAAKANGGRESTVRDLDDLEDEMHRVAPPPVTPTRAPAHAPGAVAVDAQAGARV